MEIVHFLFWTFLQKSYNFFLKDSLTYSGHSSSYISVNRELTTCMLLEEMREHVGTFQWAPKKPLAPLADLLVTFMLSG